MEWLFNTFLPTRIPVVLFQLCERYNSIKMELKPTPLNFISFSTSTGIEPTTESPIHSHNSEWIQRLKSILIRKAF